MSEDYYDFQEINHNKIILFGRKVGGVDFDREMTMQERDKLYAFVARQDAEKYRFLRDMANTERTTNDRD